MSQVESLEPAATAERHGIKERFETFLRNFEWNWTKAAIFCLALTFVVLLTTSVIPSFWLYFADQKLKWDGGTAHTFLFWNLSGFWLKEMRDAVAMGLVTVPFIAVLVASAILQNWRRKLRGSSGDTRPTGGYR
jgi:hypothetical protein